MSSIKIDVNNIKSTNQNLKTLSSELADIENSLSSIRLSLDHRIAQRGNIDQRLSQTVKSMNELEMKFKKMHFFIDESMDQYIEADKKAKSPPLKKEKSIWNQFLDGLTTAYNSTKGFVTGLADSVVSTVDGLWQVIRHPIKTAKGLVYVVQHPVKTGEATWQTIKDSWNKDVVNGDAESSSHWFGRAFGEAALALVGTKGVDKTVKLTKGTKLIEEVGGVKVTYGIQDGGKVVNSSNEVNRINNINKGPGSGAEELITYRRVQGGTPPNASRTRINVDSNGIISIPNKKANLNISTGNDEHAKYFLNKRGGNAEIVEFDIPIWFDDFLNENAIPQIGYKNNPLNQGGTAPKIVDPATPGKSYELPPPWIEWLEEYAKSGRKIKKIKGKYRP